MACGIESYIQRRMKFLPQLVRSIVLGQGVPHPQPLMGEAQTTGVKAEVVSFGVWRSLKHMQCSVLTCVAPRTSM